MEKPSYNDYIEGCIKGDRAAQKKLYEALSPKMFALCIRYMGEPRCSRRYPAGWFRDAFQQVKVVL